MWKMMRENIQSMGKSKRSIYGLICLTSLLFVISMAYFMMENTIDKQSVQRTDSHLLTVKWESTGKGKAQEKMQDFYDYMVKYEKETSIFAETTGMLNIHYQGFPQFSQYICRMSGFSVISNTKISEKDLVCGKIPANRNEIVIDKWLLKRCRKDNPAIGELYSKDEEFLNVKVSVLTGGDELTIVGISDTKEPAVYAGDSVIYSMSSSGNQVMTDRELRELSVTNYEQVSLEENEVLVRRSLLEKGGMESSEGETEQDWILSQLEEKCGEECTISGYFDEDLGVDYIVSEKMLKKMIQRQILQSHQCQIYVSQTETARKDFLKEAEKYRSYFTVTIIRTGKEQLKQYQEEHRGMIQMWYFIVIPIGFLSLFIIYLAVKSNVMQRREELEVYALLNIPNKSIMKVYKLEMFWMTACICIPVIVTVSFLIKFVAAIPSLNIYLYFPWWLVMLMILVQIFVNMEIGKWSVQSCYRKMKNKQL
jgi:ABC-type antimicrobial peptide transport system permease subunit